MSKRKGDSIGGGLNSMPAKSSSTAAEKTNFSLPEFLTGIHGSAQMDAILRDPQLARHLKKATGIIKNLTQQSSSLRSSAESSSPFTAGSFGDCVTNPCTIEEIVGDEFFVCEEGISGQKRKSSTQFLNELFESPIIDPEYGDVELLDDSDDNEFADEIHAFVKKRLNSPNCECDYCRGFDLIDPTNTIDNLPMSCDDVNNFRVPLGFDFSSMLIPESKGESFFSGNKTSEESSSSNVMKRRELDEIKLLDHRYGSPKVHQSTSTVPAANNSASTASACDRNDIVFVSEDNGPNPTLGTGVNATSSPSSLKSVILKSGEMIIEQMQKGEYDEVLLVSAASGHLEMLKLMLNSGKCKIDKPGVKELNALMEAATGGHLECVKELIKHGANVNAKTKQGNTALMYACAMGYLEIVAELVKSGAEIDAQNVNGHTALMEAASAGHCDVAQFLVNKGCNMFVNSVEYKETALTLAAYKGHYNMVKYLIFVGPPASEREDEMHTALMEASMDGHVDVARLLINSGAQVNMPPESYESPLTLAACGGHVELGWLLIQRGANLEEMNDEGYTALMEAAREGHEEMVSLLIQSGAKVNVIGEENRESALFMAASAGYSEVVEMLLKVGADTELGNSTPLIEASQEGHLDIVNLLLDAGAHVNAVNINKQTPLLVAADSGHLDVVQTLLARGALVDKIGEGGMTPLMKAASNGHESVVAMLIKAKANINLISENMTALAYACIKGHENVVDLLLSRGADPLLPIKDSQGVDSNLLIETSKIGSVIIIKKLIDRPQQTEALSAQRNRPSNCKEQRSLSSSDRTHAGEQLLFNVFCNFYEHFIVKQSEQFKNSNPTISGDEKSEEQTLDQMFEHVIPGLWLEKHLHLEQLMGVKCQHFDSVDRSCQTDPADLLPDCVSNDSKQASIVREGQIIRDHLNIDFDDGTFGDNLNPIQFIYGIKNRRIQRVGYLEDSVFEIFKVLSEWVERKPSKDNLVSKLLDLIKSDDHKFNEVLLKPTTKSMSSKFHSIFCDELVASVFRLKQFENRADVESPVEIEPFELEDEQNVQNEQVNSIDSTTSTTVDHKKSNSQLSTGNKGTSNEGSPIPQPVKSVLSDPNFQPFQSVTRKHEARNSFKQKVQNGLKPDDPLNNSENWAKSFPVSLPKATVLEKKIEKTTNSKYRLPSNNFRAGVVAAAKGGKLTLDSRNKLDPRLNRDRRPKPNPTAEVNTNKLVTLNSTNANNETCLSVAAAGGYLEMVKFLLAHGADIEHREKKGHTPLMLAAREGHVDIVQHLIEAGANTEASSERTKDTALTLASSAGHYDAVSMLLNKGANKEHRNVSDYTSLALAAAGGHREVINLLLGYGAEINSRTGSKLGISPLMLAAMNGHAEVLKLLLDRGGDINAYIETNRNTALTLACFQGRADCVQLLLERGAIIEHRAKTGLTPLMEAASGGFADVGRVLIEHGADINAPPVPASKDTALTIAADKGHSEFVKLLLEYGAFIDVKNKKGYSPLWLACNSGHIAVVKILVEAKCDVDSQDNRKVSCIMAACRKGHLEIVQFLLQHVTQLPSDQDIKRSAELCTDDLRDKVETCSEALLVAKERQKLEADRHAASLLEQIDQERSREEKRKAAAARKKKKKDERKKAKKQETKVSEDQSESSEYDKKPEKTEKESSSPSMSSSKPEEEEEDETSAITGNDEEFEHFDEILIEEFDSPQFLPQEFEDNGHGSSKKNNKSNKKNNKIVPPKTAKVTCPVKEKPITPPVTPKIVSPPTPEPETIVKRVSKKHSDVKTKVASGKANKLPKISPVPPVNTSSSGKENGKRDEGWREVTQVGRRGKRVNVPSSAISRVIGRAGCNINTVRELSGAYIEVEKQAPGQTDRWVLIRGSPEASKYASQLINSLANSPDTELSEHIFELGLEAIPVLTSNDGPVPTTNAISYVESIFGSKACSNMLKSFKNPTNNQFGSAGTPSSVFTSKSQVGQNVCRNVVTSTVRSHSSNDSVRQNKPVTSYCAIRRNLNQLASKDAAVPSETKLLSPSPTQIPKPTERTTPEVPAFAPPVCESSENPTSVWCKSPVNSAPVLNPSTSPRMHSKVPVEVAVDEPKTCPFNRAYVSPGSFSTTSTSSLCSANTVPLNITTTNPLVQNNNFAPLGNVRSAPCTPPIGNLSARMNKFDANQRIMSSSGSTFEPTAHRQFSEFENFKSDFQSINSLYGVPTGSEKLSPLCATGRFADSSLNEPEASVFRSRQSQPAMQNMSQKVFFDYLRNSNQNPIPQPSPAVEQPPAQKMGTVFNDMGRRNISQFSNQSFPYGNGLNQSRNNLEHSRFMLNQNAAPGLSSNNADIAGVPFLTHSFNSNNQVRMMTNNPYSVLPTHQAPQARNADGFNSRFNSYQRPQEPSNSDRNGAMFNPNFMVASHNYENSQEDTKRNLVPIGAERAKKQSTQQEQLPVNEPITGQKTDFVFDPFKSPSCSNPMNSSSFFGFGANINDFAEPLFSQLPQANFNDALTSHRSTWAPSSIIEPDSFFVDPSPNLNRLNGHSFINGGVDSDYYSSSSSSSVNKPLPNVGAHQAPGLNQFVFKNDRAGGWNN